MTSLIVLSPQRWPVATRLQCWMSHLSRRYRVVFVEEPVHDAGPARLERSASADADAAEVDVRVPHLPGPANGFDDAALARLGPLLAGWLRDAAIDDCVVWFGTPSALPLATMLRPRAIVYDCVDAAPAAGDAALRTREAALLDAASLVLAGDAARDDAKRSRHGHVHRLADGIDAARFRPAALDLAGAPAQQVERLHAGIGWPRLGLFGPAGARVDATLLGALADQHPEWQIVVAAPVDDAAAAPLPRRANVHALGAQPRALWPYLLAGWDVALLPYAVDAAAAAPAWLADFIAGEKPVVSTPLADVVARHRDGTVRIGATADAFVAACEAALNEDRGQRARRVAAMREAAQRSIWTQSAAAVQRLVDAALERAPPAAAPPRAAPATARARAF